MKVMKENEVLNHGRVPILLDKITPKRLKKPQLQGSHLGQSRALTKGQLRNRGLEFSHFWLDLWPGHPGHYQVLTTWDVNCSKNFGDPKQHGFRLQNGWQDMASWWSNKKHPSESFPTLSGAVRTLHLPFKKQEWPLFPSSSGWSNPVHVYPNSKFSVLSLITSFQKFVLRIKMVTNPLKRVGYGWWNPAVPLVKIKIAGSCGCSSTNKIMIFDHSMDIQNNLITQ